MTKICTDLTVEDLPSICRICLKKNSVLNISQVHFKDTDAKTIFKTILQEELLDNDQKPQNICVYCIRMLNQFYNFINMYKDCKKVLENFLEQSALERNAIVKTECEECDYVDENILQPIETKFLNEIVLITSPEISPIKQEVNVHQNIDLPPLVPISFKKEKIEPKQEPKKPKNDKKEKKKMKSKIAGKTVQCQVCWKTVPCQLLLKHREAKHADHRVEGFTTRTYEICALCNKKILRIHLKGHYQRLHKNEAIQIKPGATVIERRPDEACNICGKLIKSNRLKQHFRKAHEGAELNYSILLASEVCALCNKRLCRYSLAPHFKRFHKGQEVQIKPNEGIDEQLISCDICGKQINYSYISKHYKHVHEAERLHKEGVMCEICGKYFWTKSLLKLHSRKEHEGFRYYCELCPDRTFSAKHTLKRHNLRFHKE